MIQRLFLNRSITNATFLPTYSSHKVYNRFAFIWFFSPSVRVTLEIRISYDFKLVLKEGTDEVKAIKTFLFKRYSFSTRLQNEKITTVDLKVIS